MKNISLDKIQIGEGYMPLVIPEIGINHNGSLEIAKRWLTQLLWQEFAL